MPFWFNTLSAIFKERPMRVAGGGRRGGRRRPSFYGFSAGWKPPRHRSTAPVALNPLSRHHRRRSPAPSRHRRTLGTHIIFFCCLREENMWGKAAYQPLKQNEKPLRGLHDFLRRIHNLTFTSPSFNSICSIDRLTLFCCPQEEEYCKTF